MASFYNVLKRNKKLFIIENGERVVYTPPDFIRLDNREPLEKLALEMSALGRRDVGAIIKFESSAKRARN